MQVKDLAIGNKDTDKLIEGVSPIISVINTLGATVYLMNKVPFPAFGKNAAQIELDPEQQSLYAAILPYMSDPGLIESSDLRKAYMIALGQGDILVDLKATFPDSNGTFYIWNMGSNCLLRTIPESQEEEPVQHLLSQFNPACITDPDKMKLTITTEYGSARPAFFKKDGALLLISYTIKEEENDEESEESELLDNPLSEECGEVSEQPGS